MKLFVKAAFLLLLTGPSAVSKRLNKKRALSQLSVVGYSQPTLVEAKTSAVAGINSSVRHGNPVEEVVHDNALKGSHFMRSVGRFIEIGGKEFEELVKKGLQKLNGSKRQMTIAEWDHEISNTIRLSASFEMCLHAPLGELNQGNLIQIHSCSGAPNEKFEMHTDSTIRVKSKPEMCFSYQSGDLNRDNRIQLHSCSAASNKLFEMHSDYTIQAVRSNPPMCLSAEIGNLNHDNVIRLLPCSPGARNQQFLAPDLQGEAAAEAKAAKEKAENASKIATFETAVDDADHLRAHISDIAKKSDAFGFEYATSESETEDEKEESASATANVQDESKIQPAPPASPEEKIMAAEAALTPAQQAFARWSEASPQGATVGEAEGSEAFP